MDKMVLVDRESWVTRKQWAIALWKSWEGLNVRGWTRQDTCGAKACRIGFIHKHLITELHNC